MSLIADLKSLEPSQRSAIWASYLGWTLDAFDYFLLTFMLAAIAKEFGTDVKAVTVAIMLTLAARPFGAFFFGLLADRFGRRPILMIVVLAFSVFSVAVRPSALADPAARHPHPVRLRHGRRVGNRRQPGHGIDPREASRAGLGPAPERLPVRLFHRQHRLFRLVRRHWLARHVLRRSRSRAPRPPHPDAREGKSGLRREEGKAARQSHRRAGPQLEDRALHDCADGGLQRVQPRHPGPLSDLPPGPASLRYAPHRHSRRHHECRRDRRRNLASGYGRKGSAASVRSSSPACSRFRLFRLWAFSRTPLLLGVGAS